MNRYNAEGYIDLTAYEALSRIEREERKAKKAAAYRPLVYYPLLQIGYKNDIM